MNKFRFFCNKITGRYQLGVSFGKDDGVYFELYIANFTLGLQKIYTKNAVIMAEDLVKIQPTELQMAENRANRMVHLYESALEDIEELKIMLTHSVYCPLKKSCYICDSIEEKVRYE